MKTQIKLLLTALLFSTSAAASALQVGDQAPDFLLEATDGKSYSLSQYKGEQAVVIAWYPKAYTSGCTIECKSPVAPRQIFVATRHIIVAPRQISAAAQRIFVDCRHIRQNISSMVTFALISSSPLNCELTCFVVTFGCEKLL